MSSRELFVRWFVWSVKEGDCDPALWTLNYLHKRFEHSTEERAWLAWLYGTTYQLPTAWVIKQEFPDLELAAHGRVTDWNTRNYKRLRYQTDTKWNKGHLPAMLASYRSWVGNREQVDALTGDSSWTPQQRFAYLWDQIKREWYKFGRYSTWFYLQTLKHTAGVATEPTSLMLEDWDGSRSHRNGLLLAAGVPQAVDARMSSQDVQRLEHFALDVLQEARARYPEQAEQLDLYSMETALCSFKKLWRVKDGRYPGYYLDRQFEEIQRAAGDGWAGVDWNVLHQARAETLRPSLLGTGVDTAAMQEFLGTGTLQRLAWL